jgi:Na+/H+ antiporter NhaC
MTKTKKIILALAAVVIIALLVVAYVTEGAMGTVTCPDCTAETVAECETCGGAGAVRGTWWALIPPFIAIALALITKEAYSSLFIGIVVGGVLSANFSFTAAVDSVIGTGLIDAVSGTAGIFVFLVELGIVVALVNKAGGSRAFGEWAKKHIKTRIGAQLATFVLGVLIFIDDYFNCLTVGSVMRPVTDKAKISRAKLAYLIDATAAPICMIAPVSSWAAAVSSYAPEGVSGLKMFIQAIPYNFYSLLTFVFVIGLVVMKFDFGPMKKAELAVISAELESAADDNSSSRGRVWDLIVPIIVLIISCVLALLYVGGYFGVDIWGGAECAGSIIDSFGNTDATVGLPWGGLIALVVIIAYLVIRRVVSFKVSMECVPQGFIAMVPAILILTFATALKNMTGVLGTKYYVGDLMMGSAEALNMFLPAVIFIVACILAFATGTSWGTFGILIPIVLAIFPAGSVLGTIGMSACLAGAVCGDHCSPISDTTIMSSAGAECDHVEHVSTQLPYAITVAAISFVCYIAAGFVQNPWIMLAIGAAITIATLAVIKAVTKKNA